jgi:hypothetical protein
MTSAAAVVFVAGLTAISFWFLVALWFFDKWHARTLEDRKLQRADQQMLLSRIQDPVQAVAVHSVQAARASMPEPAQRVEFDNDESFWDSLGVDPLAADLADQNGHAE